MKVNREYWFYEYSGLYSLKKLIMLTFGKFVLLFNPPEKMPSYFIAHPFRVKSLEVTLKWTYFNEIVHIILTLVCIAIGFSFWLRDYQSGIIIFGFMVLLNAALSALQHFHRARIRKVIRYLGVKNCNPSI